MPRRTLLLAAGWLLSACLERELACPEDAPCKVDACGAGACAGDGGSPPVFGCTDSLEPNDRPQSARVIGAGRFSQLRICPGDEDWFALDLDADDRVTVSVTGAPGATDLDLALHAPDGRALARSNGPSAEERIADVRARTTGRYLVRVYAPDGGGGDYTLAVERLSRSCAASAVLDPAVARHAAELPPAASGSASAATSVFYRATLAAGENVRVWITVTGGDLDLGFYRADGRSLRPLAVTRGAGGSATAQHGPVSAPEEIIVRIFGRTATPHAFVLASERSTSRAARSGRISGIARFEDRPIGASGLGPPQPAPIRLALVEVYRESDGYVVGVGATDPDGRFDVPYVNYGDPLLGVRVLARRRDGFARLDVLRSESCPEIYAVRASGPIDSGAEPAANVEIIARATDAGGALNVFSALGSALQFLQFLGLPPPSRALTAYWERGVGQSCGSCYADGAIYVGGAARDPDEYDDPVLLHELGHFYEEVYGRSDSPGGDHDGSRTDPTLAWSEGFATFFASLVRDTPLYVDTFDGEVLVDDLETLDDTGTEGDVLTGAVSENLVAGLLWDLRDEGAAEPFDAVSLDPAGLLLPTRLYLRDPARLARGVAGVDLVDYLDGLLCFRVTADGAIAPIVAARRFPYDYAGPRDCLRKPRAPVDLDLDVTHEGPGAGVRVRVRARARAAADAMRLTARLPAGWRLLAGKAERVVGTVRAGHHLELDLRVLPGKEGALSVAAVLHGPGRRIRPAVGAWPAGARRRPPLGRSGRSAQGLPLFVLGGSP